MHEAIIRYDPLISQEEKTQPARKEGRMRPSFVEAKSFLLTINLFAIAQVIEALAAYFFCTNRVEQGTNVALTYHFADAILVAGFRELLVLTQPRGPVVLRIVWIRGTPRGYTDDCLGAL